MSYDHFVHNPMFVRLVDFDYNEYGMMYATIQPDYTTYVA